MERLTKIDGTGRNVIEVKRFCRDDDWILSEMADGITISFHSKAIDNLANLKTLWKRKGLKI